MVQLTVERTIAAAPDLVFGWLIAPRNLTAARLILSARFAQGSTAPGVGAVREATAVGMWLREEITAYDPPRSYSYRIVRAFPAFHHEGGTVTVTPSGAGAVAVWNTRYTHPAIAGGRVLEAITSRAIRAGFLEILAGCAKALEAPAR